MIFLTRTNEITDVKVQEPDLEISKLNSLLGPVLGIAVFSFGILFSILLCIYWRMVDQESNYELSLLDLIHQPLSARNPFTHKRSYNFPDPGKVNSHSQTKNLDSTNSQSMNPEFKHSESMNAESHIL